MSYVKDLEALLQVMQEEDGMVDIKVTALEGFDTQEEAAGAILKFLDSPLVEIEPDGLF